MLCLPAMADAAMLPKGASVKRRLQKRQRAR